MKILVTGAKGFIGKNLCLELRQKGYTDIFEYDINTPPNLLETYVKECEFVFHLAGVNRPQNEEEYMLGNFGFTSTLLNLLEGFGNKAPVLITSSIQAERDNPYGKSKKSGEDLMFSYGKKNGVKVLVYRLANVFGKWSRPNYNSAVATFCYNIARDLPIQVNDSSVDMRLVYIDDILHEFLRAINDNETRDDNTEFCKVPELYQTKLGIIVDLLYSFKQMRKTLGVPNMNNEFEKKLYSTYLSYIPTDDFSYPLKMNVDDRGSFTEIIRTEDRGQFSVNVAKPGITKGNHWHHSKNEKFLVVSGRGVIRFRKVDESEIYEYHVSGENLEVVDIPTGYTHSIKNEGDTDLITFMWANEPFDPENPDTFFLEV